MGRWLFFPSNVGSYLLDTYTGASAAYSLRQLKTGVTNVVRVRRSSDNTESDFTATQVTDGTLTTWTGANNGLVTKWYDQSGNGLDVLQATTTRQGYIVEAGTLVTENGKPAIKAVEGVNGTFYAPAANTNIAQPNTAIAVAKISSTSVNNGFIYDGNHATNRNALFRNHVSAAFRCFAGTELVIGASNFNQNLHATLFNGASSFSSLNGGSNVTGNAGSASFDLIRIGNAGNEGGFTTLRGNFQEIVVWNANKTTDLAGIKSNVNTHYAIY